jgi:NADH-quinone oxidoreductase subunit I
MSMVDIAIDRQRCPVPLDCRKCITICPQAVFELIPTNLRRFEEVARQDWVLRVRYRPDCVACMDCVKVCPQKALKVKVQS